MPAHEAPCVELGTAPQPISEGVLSPSSSEVSGTSSPDPQNIRPSPLFRVLAMTPPEPEQPPGQDELERRLPGYRRVVIPRELTLIELLKESSGVTTDEEVLYIREAKLRVIADRVGLRRLHVLAPCLRTLTLDGSAISSLRDLGIGLVHLKILSVNKCGLTSLDGIWGLSGLRELHAAHNKLQDLSALAALQKLHTLNVAHNPDIDLSRLWMLAVCGSLRKVTLEGTRAADEPTYRSSVASALPLLIYLDDHPLHTDIDDDIEGLIDDPGSSSESEGEGGPSAKAEEKRLSAESEPDPPTAAEGVDKKQDKDENMDELEAEVYKCPNALKLHQRQRPATTECAGVRPKHQLPPRPKTALERPPMEPSTRLEIMNTLMDEEWRCSGSKLTSHGAVCGNLAQALRRPSTSRRSRERASHESLIEYGIDMVSRELAEEIPRAPKLDDWARFKEKTGIDIDIDFNKQLDAGDPLAAIERLERIERETSERLANPDKFCEDFDIKDRASFLPVNYELWKMENFSMFDDTRRESRVYTPLQDRVDNVGIDELFNNISLNNSEGSLPD